MLEAEPAAQAAEAANDLVGDQQDAVLAANGLDLFPVARGWDDDAAGALHRLADECRHVLRAHLQDARFDGRGSSRAKTFLILAEAVAEPIRLHHMLDAGDRQVALRVHQLHAAEAGRGDGGTVV